MGKKLKVKKEKQNQKPVKTPAGTAVSSAPAVSVAKVEPPISPEQQLKANELNSLIDDAEEAESGSRGFMEPQATVKKKRGRPSNAERAAREAESANEAAGAPPPLPPAPSPEMKEAATFLFQMISLSFTRYVNVQTGIPMTVLQAKGVGATPEELESLGHIWGMVGDRYLPSVRDHALLIAAAGCTGKVGFRIYSSIGALVEEVRAQEAVKRGERQSQPVQEAMTQ